MQLKYSFKKEWSQFFRTFRLWGVILAIFSFALSYPLMFKFLTVFMEEAENMFPEQVAAVLSLSGEGGAAFSSTDINAAFEMFSDGGQIFATSLVSFAAYGLLITCLILMSAAGGEQKKRAMIVPMCSGLDYKNYLLPKFTMYPTIVFAVTFLAALTAGGLCAVMFADNAPSGEVILLCSLLISVYMAFMVSVFLSLGLCTSRPGIMAPAVFVGEMFLESMLNGFGLTKYHPFALLGYVNSLTNANAGISIADEAVSIVVSIAISVVIAVLMYFLALGVLKAKKIDNQEENKPEF